MRASKFRETYWFKMGAATAEQSAVHVEEDAVPADTLRPVEDRYDNATVSVVDRAEFGLHTGLTAALPRFKATDVPHVPEQLLIAEMHGRRRLYIGVLLTAAAAAVGSLVVLL